MLAGQAAKAIQGAQRGTQGMHTRASVSACVCMCVCVHAHCCRLAEQGSKVDREGTITGCALVFLPLVWLLSRAMLVFFCPCVAAASCNARLFLPPVWPLSRAMLVFFAPCVAAELSRAGCLVQDCRAFRLAPKRTTRVRMHGQDLLQSLTSSTCALEAQGRPEAIRHYRRGDQGLVAGTHLQQS